MKKITGFFFGTLFWIFEQTLVKELRRIQRFAKPSCKSRTNTWSSIFLPVKLALETLVVEPLDVEAARTGGAEVGENSESLSKISSWSGSQISLVIVSGRPVSRVIVWNWPTFKYSFSFEQVPLTRSIKEDEGEEFEEEDEDDDEVCETNDSNSIFFILISTLVY